MESRDPLVRIEDSLAAVVRLLGLPRVHERVLALAGIVMDPSVYGVLGRISDHEPLRLSELARLLGIEKSTASRKVKQLRSAGLLVRDPDESDGRASFLRLSGEGRRVLDTLRSGRHALVGEVFAAWSPDDLEQLAPLLERVASDFAEYAITAAGADVGRETLSIRA